MSASWLCLRSNEKRDRVRALRQIPFLCFCYRERLLRPHQSLDGICYHGIYSDRGSLVLLFCLGLLWCMLTSFVHELPHRFFNFVPTQLETSCTKASHCCHARFLLPRSKVEASLDVKDTILFVFRWRNCVRAVLCGLIPALMIRTFEVPGQRIRWSCRSRSEKFFEVCCRFSSIIYCRLYLIWVQQSFFVIEM